VKTILGFAAERDGGDAGGDSWYIYIYILALSPSPASPSPSP